MYIKTLTNTHNTVYEKVKLNCLLSAKLLRWLHVFPLFMKEFTSEGEAEQQDIECFKLLTEPQDLERFLFLILFRFDLASRSVLCLLLFLVVYLFSF